MPVVVAPTDLPGVGRLACLPECGVGLKAVRRRPPPCVFVNCLLLLAPRALAGAYALAWPASVFCNDVGELGGWLALIQSLIGWLGNSSFVVSLQVARRRVGVSL